MGHLIVAVMTAMAATTAGALWWAMRWRALATTRQAPADPAPTPPPAAPRPLIEPGVADAAVRGLAEPMHGLLGLVDGLLGEAPASARQARILRQIAECRDALTARLGRLADHAAAGDPPSDAARLDPGLMLREAMAAAAPSARDANVGLAPVRPTPGLSTTAPADALARVLADMATTAIRMTPSGGAVWAAAHPATQGVRLTVSSPGPIDAASAAALLSPERLADDAPSLLAARRRARAFGAELRVSAGSDGLEMALDMPGGADERAAGLEGAVVLYVDDHAPSRLMMRCLLEALGARPHLAETAEHGLALARALAPDLIVTDIVMPGLDGLAFKALLDQEPLACRIPVIALTARGPATAQDQAAGFADWLVKPAEPARIAAALARLHAPRGVEAAA